MYSTRGTKSYGHEILKWPKDLQLAIVFAKSIQDRTGYLQSIRLPDSFINALNLIMYKVRCL